jgi:hypothetical protein
MSDFFCTINQVKTGDCLLFKAQGYVSSCFGTTGWSHASLVVILNKEYARRIFDRATEMCTETMWPYCYDDSESVYLLHCNRIECVLVPARQWWIYYGQKHYRSAEICVCKYNLRSHLQERSSVGSDHSSEQSMEKYNYRLETMLRFIEEVALGSGVCSLTDRICDLVFNCSFISHAKFEAMLIVRQYHSEQCLCTTSNTEVIIYCLNILTFVTQQHLMVPNPEGQTAKALYPAHAIGKCFFVHTD